MQSDSLIQVRQSQLQIQELENETLKLQKQNEELNFDLKLAQN